MPQLKLEDIMTEKAVREFPFIIRPENVSRYEDGEVFILDRRVYPFEVRFERCKTYAETAQAIKDMVTQSGGPGKAAAQGMIQAAHQARDKSLEGIANELDRAYNLLLSTRPTCDHLRNTTTKMLKVGKEAIENGEDVEQALISAMHKETQQHHEKMTQIGKAGASLLEDGDVILNHCWAEGGIIYTLYEALEQGKKLEAVCTETRPYLQGARLTADAIADFGIPTTLVTDGMPGYLMSKGRINKFMTGADRVTMSGHVVNKIGTMQLALSAHHFRIPYFAFSDAPDLEAPLPEDVIIEERNPEDVLHCMGVRTATHKATGYYPAFDITPPEFVSAVITPKGVFSPYDLGRYYR
jgi:methylthioribose-1-phosphate isomerase